MMLPVWLMAGVFAVIFVGVLIVMVVSVVLRWRAAEQQGLDPMAADIQLMGQVQRSALLAPDRPVDERLAELDRLAEQGTISSEEHRSHRARILGDL